MGVAEIAEKVNGEEVRGEGNEVLVEGVVERPGYNC